MLDLLTPLNKRMFVQTGDEEVSFWFLFNWSVWAQVDCEICSHRQKQEEEGKSFGNGSFWQPMHSAICFTYLLETFETRTLSSTLPSSSFWFIWLYGNLSNLIENLKKIMSLFLQMSDFKSLLKLSSLMEQEQNDSISPCSSNALVDSKAKNKVTCVVRFMFRSTANRQLFSILICVRYFPCNTWKLVLRSVMLTFAIQPDSVTCFFTTLRKPISIGKLLLLFVAKVKTSWFI